MLSHINMFDASVIGVMVLSCIFAFYRGLVREVLSLIAWVGAGIVTVYYFQNAAQALQPHFRSVAMARGVAALGLYLGALIAFGIINTLIVKSIKSSGEAGALDNVLGLGFGALRGALIVSLGYFLITVALSEKEYPDWLKASVTRPYAEKGARILIKAAPNTLREISSLERKAEGEAQDMQQRNIQEEPVQPSYSGGYSIYPDRQVGRPIDETAAPSR